MLAMVLREGVTNILRHSKVERCEIVMVRADRIVRLDILNDGLSGPDLGAARDPYPVADRESVGLGGSGLRSLAERVATLGGELTAGVDPDHRFRLRVTMPV